jgi:hypothetical protein
VGSPASAWSNVTRTLPSTKGIVVGYRFYANETYRGWCATSIGSLVVTKPQGWEETRLTMRIDPAPSMLTPPMWFDVSGSLTFVGNGTGIGGARLQVFIGYGDEFGLITTMVTEASGCWSFYWNPTATGQYIMRIVYQSDRSWALGTHTEQSITM